MRRSWTKIRSALLGIVLVAGFLTGFSSPASAASNLYWKTGSAVTHAKVFDGDSNSNMSCYAPSGHSTTLCIRFDRKTMYVRSDASNGYFKLGQWTGGGNIYRCQNNHKNSKGNGTWVGCKFNWPKDRCYTMKTGHGQADWYVLSHDSGLKCI